MTSQNFQTCMVGPKKNVETFAKWKGIKITYKGGKSGTVTKQSVAAGKALSKTKKITITLGD